MNPFTYIYDCLRRLFGGIRTRLGRFLNWFRRTPQSTSENANPAELEGNNFEPKIYELECSTPGPTVHELFDAKHDSSIKTEDSDARSGDDFGPVLLAMIEKQGQESLTASEMVDSIATRMKELRRRDEELDAELAE